jgi:hypothetical protein
MPSAGFRNNECPVDGRSSVGMMSVSERTGEEKFGDSVELMNVRAQRHVVYKDVAMHGGRDVPFDQVEESVEGSGELAYVEVLFMRKCRQVRT